MVNKHRPVSSCGAEDNIVARVARAADGGYKTYDKYYHHRIGPRMWKLEMLGGVWLGLKNSGVMSSFRRNRTQQGDLVLEMSPDSHATRKPPTPWFQFMYHPNSAIRNSFVLFTSVR